MKNLNICGTTYTGVNGITVADDNGNTILLKDDATRNAEFSDFVNGTTVNFTNTSLTQLGDSTFEGFSSLTTCIVPNVTQIGQRCFYGCSNLSALELGAITTVPSYAFHNCTSLTSLPDISRVTSFSGYAFYNCSSLTTMPDLSSVTSFGNRCFAGVPLTSITLPENATYSSNVFADSSKKNTTLTELTVPAGSNIKDSQACFEYLTGVQRITFGGNLSDNRIGTYLFNHNTNCLVYDFTACTAVQILNSNFSMTFENINANCKIVVPDDLYSTWITTGNWSQGASYIISESDYANL